MMSVHVHNIYIDFFKGYIIRNGGEGIDCKGDPEYGVNSNSKPVSITMTYVLRSN